MTPPSTLLPRIYLQTRAAQAADEDVPAQDGQDSSEAVPAPEASDETSPSEESEAQGSTEETGADSEASAPPEGGPDQFQLRVSGAFGYGGFDLGNNSGFDHSGVFVRPEVGFEYDINRDLFIQANVHGSFAFPERGLGAGVSSSLSTYGVGVNGRFGWSGFDDNLRLSAGVGLGYTHVSSPTCEDGISCGTAFTGNAQLYGINSGGMHVEGEVNLETLGGGLGVAARIGGIFGVNPSVDLLTQPDNPAFGLNMPFWQVEIRSDLAQVVRMIMGAVSGGSDSASSDVAEPTESDGEPNEPVQEPGESTQEPEGPSGPAEPATPSERVQGMALIQQHLEEVTGENGLAAQVRAGQHAARQASDAYRTAFRRRPRDMEQLRVLAIEVYQSSSRALEAYSRIQELMTEANRERIQGRVERGDLGQARQLIAQMSRARSQVRQSAGSAYRAARAVVVSSNFGYDRISGVSDPIGFELQNPTPPARARPRPRGGSGEGSSEEATQARPTPAPPAPAQQPSGGGATTPPGESDE